MQDINSLSAITTKFRSHAQALDDDNSLLKDTFRGRSLCSEICARLHRPQSVAALHWMLPPKFTQWIYKSSWGDCFASGSVKSFSIPTILENGMNQTSFAIFHENLTEATSFWVFSVYSKGGRTFRNKHIKIVSRWLGWVFEWGRYDLKIP